MSLVALTGGVMPGEWFIAFKRTTTLRLADWLAFGRFKHVMCFGYVPGAAAWVFYDFGAARASLSVVPDGRADGLIDAATEGAMVLRYVPPVVLKGLRLKPAFVCTSAVAHLTGVPSCALRPDRFMADCLAAGAEIVIGDDIRLDEARPAGAGGAEGRA